MLSQIPQDLRHKKWEKLPPDFLIAENSTKCKIQPFFDRTLNMRVLFLSEFHKNGTENFLKFPLNTLDF